jgi:uncharacterized membrane protein YtjA (UPF0391 family)
MLSILYFIAALILAIWLLGFVLNFAGGLIHVLLVVAVVLILISFFSGRRTVL